MINSSSLNQALTPKIFDGLEEFMGMLKFPKPVRCITMEYLNSYEQHILSIFEERTMSSLKTMFNEGSYVYPKIVPYGISIRAQSLMKLLDDFKNLTNNNYSHKYLQEEKRYFQDTLDDMNSLIKEPSDKCLTTIKFFSESALTHFLSLNSYFPLLSKIPQVYNMEPNDEFRCLFLNHLSNQIEPGSGPLELIKSTNKYIKKKAMENFMLHKISDMKYAIQSSHIVKLVPLPDKCLQTFEENEKENEKRGLENLENDHDAFSSFNSYSKKELANDIDYDLSRALELSLKDQSKPELEEELKESIELKLRNDEIMKDNLSLSSLISQIKNKQFHPLIDSEIIKKVKDLNAKDEEGDTPLIYAVMSGFPIIVNQLISAKANVNTPSVVGNTPLMHAAMKTSPLTLVIIDVLIKAGADKSLKNLEGDTALRIAMASRNLEAIKLLKDKQEPASSETEDYSHTSLISADDEDFDSSGEAGDWDLDLDSHQSEGSK